MKNKKRWIALDADYLVFSCTEGKNVKMTVFGKEDGEVEEDGYKEPLKPYKKKFKRLVQDIEDAMAANFVGQVKGIKVFLSDPETNFRYDLYAEYKARRSVNPRSELFYRLRDWAIKKYGYVKNMEADDVVGYYVAHKNYFGASMDKDLLKGVPGDWYDVYHSRGTYHKTSLLEARNFNLLQTLMGDITDNIKGIPRVGEATAMKLLDKHGWDWNGVVASYEEKGLTEDDAILNRRLVGMDQWSPKKGLKLFKRSNNE